MWGPPTYDFRSRLTQELNVEDKGHIIPVRYWRLECLIYLYRIIAFHTYPSDWSDVTKCFFAYIVLVGVNKMCLKEAADTSQVIEVIKHM